MFKRFFFDRKKGINPGKFFSTVLTILFISGVIAKWFLGVEAVETGDLGILIGPVIALFAQVGFTTITKLKNGYSDSHNDYELDEE
ncbi:MAG: hypothetical protein ACP6IY_22925 [Promethearchaeia archaeon]